MRISTSNLYKFINIQYFKNLIRILLYLFIINKNFFLYIKNYYSCSASREAPQVRRLFSRHRIQPLYGKKLQKIIFIHFKISVLKATFYKNVVFLLRKMSKKYLTFSLLQWCYPLNSYNISKEPIT